MKYIIAAALYAAAANATEIEGLQQGYDHLVEAGLGDILKKDHAAPHQVHQAPHQVHQAPHDQAHASYNNDECDVEGFKHQEDLDTPKYQALSAYCKQQIIWERVQRDRTPERFFVGNEFQGLFDQDMNLSFDTVSDTMPTGRIKRTHPRGVTTLMEYIPTYDHEYTGIFRGCKHVVQRISEFSLTTPEAPKTAPGFGVKFLRDGMASANLFAMFAFDGQPSFNFFKNRWSNILKEMDNDCARETIGKHMNMVTDFIGSMSVMELAEFDQYGNKEEHPHWPFMIDAEPYDVYGWTDKFQNDFHEQLQVVPKDTAMFRIYGYDCPPELDKELGCPEKHIGWLVTRSETTPSLWGDQKLFFQHHRYEDDIKHRPHYFEWLQFWDNGKFAETPLRDPAPTQKCPFLFLFENAGLL